MPCVFLSVLSISTDVKIKYLNFLSFVSHMKEKREMNSHARRAAKGPCSVTIIYKNREPL